MKELAKKITLSLAAFLAVAGLVYALNLLHRCANFYAYAKSDLWKAGICRADPVLGYAHVPNARGYDLFPCGIQVPTRFDEHGFRVPVDAAQDMPRPLILTLGCSHTYGAVCAADDAYPHQLAKRVGATEINAGVCGYGLAQMLIVAQRLIPQYEPDYVVVQYSPWLVDRAVNEFAPVQFALQPVPYFSDNGQGGVQISEPVFDSAAFRADLSLFRCTPRSCAEWMSFAKRVGVPLFLHDDWNRLRYDACRIAGHARPPTRRDGDVVAYTYGRIKELCDAHHSKMIVVVLGVLEKPVRVPFRLKEFNVCIVDAQAALCGKLPAPTRRAYTEAYNTFRGPDGVFINRHPNARAHEIIAQTLASKILEMQASTEFDTASTGG